MAYDRKRCEPHTIQVIGAGCTRIGETLSNNERHSFRQNVYERHNFSDCSNHTGRLPDPLTTWQDVPAFAITITGTVLACPGNGRTLKLSQRRSTWKKSRNGRFQKEMPISCKHYQIENWETGMHWAFVAGSS